MATSKKNTSKDKTSEKKPKKPAKPKVSGKGESPSVKIVGAKKRVPKVKKEVSEKSKPVRKTNTSAKKAEVLKSAAVSDVRDSKREQKVKPRAKKKKGKEAGTGKSQKSGSPNKLKKAIEAVKTKVKKEAEKKVGEKQISQSAVSSAKTVKKASVAVFTIDNVREILKNRRQEAREEAEKKKAAAKKAAVDLVIPENTQSRVLGAATLADILGFGPAPVRREAEPSGDFRNIDVPEKFRKYYDSLISIREKILRKINQRGHGISDKTEETPPTVPAQTDEDDSFDHNFALSLVANEQEALVEIDAALERIREGTYGICEITGRPISAERLNAVPFARYSVEGQAQYEMQNRRRTQRTVSFMDSSDDSDTYYGEEADE